MKKLFRSLFIVTLLSMLFIVTVQAQSLSYTTKSKEAKRLAVLGRTHMSNAEFEWAYSDFKEALKLDPDFTYAQVALSNLSVGDEIKMYADKARSSVTNKTDGEKMIVSLLDTKTQAERNGIWNSIHQKFPDDTTAYYLSIISNPDREAATKPLQDFLTKYPNYPPANNMMGYQLLQIKKDTAGAKQYLEKYIQLYPEGYNPYDSMGEYYLAVGDKENAKKYYTKCREKYPFSFSAQAKLAEIEKMK